MSKPLNITGLKPEQIAQIEAIIEAFKAKNKLDILVDHKINDKPQDSIDILTKNPIKVNEFLSREQIYER